MQYMVSGRPYELGSIEFQGLGWNEPSQMAKVKILRTKIKREQNLFLAAAPVGMKVGIKKLVSYAADIIHSLATVMAVDCSGVEAHDSLLKLASQSAVVAPHIRGKPSKSHSPVGPAEDEEGEESDDDEDQFHTYTKKQDPFASYITKAFKGNVTGKTFTSYSARSGPMNQMAGAGKARFGDCSIRAGQIGSLTTIDKFFDYYYGSSEHDLESGK
jgi:hypothetical protein